MNGLGDLVADVGQQSENASAGREAMAAAAKFRADFDDVAILTLRAQADAHGGIAGSGDHLHATLAELPAARKNQISHRALAAQAAREVLERWLAEGAL